MSPAFTAESRPISTSIACPISKIFVSSSLIVKTPVSLLITRSLGLDKVIVAFSLFSGLESGRIGTLSVISVVPAGKVIVPSPAV